MISNDELSALRARVAELEGRREQWELFSRATSNMLWNWDFADGSVERSVAFEEAFGYPKSEIDSAIAWWVDRLHPDDRERVLATFQRAMDEKRESCSYEYRFRRLDGSYADIRDRAFILRNERGEAVRALGAMTEISSEKAMERERTRATNLESLGQFAAGIAHDFNNMLTGVTMATSLLRETPDDEMAREELTREIDAYAGKMVALLAELLTFAKGGAPRLTSLDLAEHVRTHFQMALRGSPVALEISSEERPILVDADPSQLARALHNLALNARQAMPNGGNLRVSVGYCERATTTAGPVGEDVHWATLTVSDDGPGIREDHLDKIFDPYFSTRPDGHGIGLSVVHSVVHRHHGRVFVRSQLGKGTTFEIQLPCSHGHSPAERRTGTATSRPDHAGLRVLLLDDQPAVHRATKRALAHLGASCDGFTHSAEALAEFRRRIGTPEAFDVVIVDLTIPGDISPEEARDAFRSLSLGAKILATSGYSTSPFLAEPHAHGFDGALPKPFRLDELRSLLDEVRSGTSSSVASV